MPRFLRITLFALLLIVTAALVGGISETEERRTGERARPDVPLTQRGTPTSLTTLINRELAAINEQFRAAQEEFAHSGTFTTTSPYRDAVGFLEHGFDGAATDPGTEYVVLDVRDTAGAQNVTLTDWRLVSVVTGREAVIGRGTPTPRRNVVNSESDVVVRPGDKVFIVSGESPIGVSFRESRCTGYLGEFQSFTPALLRFCPAAVDVYRQATTSPLTASCRAFLENTPRCTSVLAQPPGESAACGTFATTHLNYTNCVARERTAENFHLANWRVYLGSRSELWRPQRELIKLFDAQDRLVDILTY